MLRVLQTGGSVRGKVATSRYYARILDCHCHPTSHHTSLYSRNHHFPPCRPFCPPRPPTPAYSFSRPRRTPIPFHDEEPTTYAQGHGSQPLPSHGQERRRRLHPPRRVEDRPLFSRDDRRRGGSRPLQRDEVHHSKRDGGQLHSPHHGDAV